jgi:pyridoxine kinase
MATILALQSQVVRGHVGNSAAQFPLQRQGHVVWAVPTVLLSSHPAHGTVAGGAMEPGRVAALVAALPVEGCDAVLSGYLGDAAHAATVTGAVARMKAGNARGIYFCDPVFAHETGLFAPRAVADAQAELVRRADIAKPNQAELEDMTGRRIRTLDAALAACAELRKRGPNLVILSSLRRDGVNSSLETLAVDGDGAYLVETPLLPGPLHGAGDLFSALFLGFTLKGLGTAAALEASVSGAHGVLAATGTDLDLHLVTAQDALISPKIWFKARRIA